jgi:2-methylcitrate dehydratase PrpD
MTSEKSLTEKLAESVVNAEFEEIPEEARHQAKLCILDTLGVALAGTTDPIHQPVNQYLEEVGGKRQSTVIGLGLKTSAPLAAFANGVFGHVLDYDDLTYLFVAHSSVVLVPAIFALGEVLKSPGKDLITAFVVGSEVQWKIGDAMVGSGDHYNKGWHSTGTIGTVGAAAAAGKMLGLDSEKMANAISISTSMAAGVREQAGTMTKSFHAGRAAENGVVAALLARGGFTGTKKAFEGKMGYFPLMANQYDLGKMGDFGKPWGIVEPTISRGLVFKLYPCCGSGDGTIDAMFSLIKDHGIKAEEVESVECFAHERKIANLFHHDPKTGLEAKFSLEYWIAIMLLERDAGLKQFTDAKVHDPRVQSLMKKVKLSYDPKMPRFPVRIEVKMKDGHTYTKTYWPLKASPENPVSDEDLIAKYRSCAQWYGLPREKTEKSIDLIMAIERLKDPGDVMKLMYHKGRKTKKDSCNS